MNNCVDLWLLKMSPLTLTLAKHRGEKEYMLLAYLVGLPFFPHHVNTLFLMKIYCIWPAASKCIMLQAPGLDSGEYRTLPLIR